MRVRRVLAAQLAGIALAFDWTPAKTKVRTAALPKSVQHAVQYTLAALSVLSLLVTLYRTPGVAPAPHRTASRIVRAGIWTVHFGIDNEGRDSQRLMRDLIRCVGRRGLAAFCLLIGLGWAGIWSWMSWDCWRRTCM